MIRSATRRIAAVVTAAAAITALGACASGTGATSPIRLGWAADIPPLDPAASDSVASFAFLAQLYPSLLAVEPGEDVPVPEIAASAEWTEPGVYTVTLKSGLAFANGDALTASDVKFSIERQQALQSEDGAWRQLAILDSVEIVDDATVAFHVKTDTDSRLPYVLAGPAGLVLDEEAYFADELTPDEDILDAQPFAGPYALTDERGDRLVLEPYGGFAGSQPAASTIELTPGDAEDLAAQLSGGSLDALAGRLGADVIETLADDEALMMSRAASGRARMLAFDFDHMPFGARTETPDGGKAFAIRVAIAQLVDREAIADSIGADWVEPLTGYLPDGVPGAADVFSTLYGADTDVDAVERATATLGGAAVETPVELSIHVALDQVGQPADAEVAALAEQLNASGLFDVAVVETDAEGLETARLSGETQAVFTSLLPANADPADYLEPFRTAGTFAPGFTDADLDGLLNRQIGEIDPEVRAATLLQIQGAVAAKLPAIPITQGVRVVFARAVITGVDLDDAFPLDLALLRR